MAFQVTEAADNASRKINIEPILVFEIDGVTNVFGARIVQKRVQIGDPLLVIGGFVIGGLVAIEDQSTLITFKDSTTKINQSINPDTGASNSISSMRISMIDKDEEVTRLITPDDTVSPTFDVLGRKCKVWQGFAGTAWKEDFIVIFRGVIDDVESAAGKVIFNIAHPDTKKRSEIFQKAETELDGAITEGISN